MDMNKPNPMVSAQPQDKFTNLTEQSPLTAPLYEAPYIVSYTDQDILEELGPALTGMGSDNGFQP
jgi:hypothetical protein